MMMTDRQLEILNLQVNSVVTQASTLRDYLYDCKKGLSWAGRRTLVHPSNGEFPRHS